MLCACICHPRSFPSIHLESRWRRICHPNLGSAVTKLFSYSSNFETFFPFLLSLGGRASTSPRRKETASSWIEVDRKMTGKEAASRFGPLHAGCYSSSPLYYIIEPIGFLLIDRQIYIGRGCLVGIAAAIALLSLSPARLFRGVLENRSVLIIGCL